MKKQIISFALFFLFIPFYKAQTDCGTDEIVMIEKSGGECNNYENYIPDKDNMENLPRLTVKVNVHFLVKNDGTGIYQPFASLQDTIDKIFSYVNRHFNELVSPELPVTPPAVEIPFTNIYFEPQAIYWDTSSFFYNQGDTCKILDYLNFFGKNKDCEINIFYTYNNIGKTWGCARTGGYPGGVTMSTHHDYPQWEGSAYATWPHSQLLAHELGHALGLPHTFQGNKGCGDDQFDDTYHPDENIHWLNCGPNEPYTNCSGGTGSLGISNNVMGYNMCREYFSPKQIGMMRYKLITSNLRNFLKDDYDAINSIIVNSNQTWNDSKFITGNITVKEGNTLTVKCNVYLSDSSNIFVEQGAKLIIDGGRLTNSNTNGCNSKQKYWYGVQVYGTSSKNQYPANNPTHQGMLVLKNGGTIEYAHEGAQNWKEGNYGTAGGVIQSDGGIFRNNRRDVAFMRYQNSLPGDTNIKRKDHSDFKNTLFITDDDFIHTIKDIKPHVTLWDVHGINFKNCTFTDEMTGNKFAVNSPVKALFSVDASYNIIPDCSSIPPLGGACPTNDLLPTSFSGYFTAIEANW